MAVITGTEGDDRLVGTAQSDDIIGYGGNDTLIAYGRSDSLFGGTGDDLLVAALTGIMYGMEDNDTFDLRQAGDVTAFGGAGNDTAILPGLRSDYTIIDEGDRNFSFYGGPNQRLYLRETELFRFANGVLTADGLVPGMVILGTEGADVIAPGKTVPGQPMISDEGDTLRGFGGEDYLDGGLGADIYYGGYGADTFVIAEQGDTIMDGEREDIALVSVAGRSIAAGTIRLVGSAHLDVTAAIANASLFGNAGNNVLIGTDAGDETLDGGAGNNRLDGLGGVDTASYATAGAGVKVNLGLKGAQNTSGAGIDTLLNIEAVVGSRFNDALAGRAGLDDLLEGGDGDDVLNGQTGVDTASYAHAAAGVTVRLTTTAAQDTHGAGVDTLKGMENLLGSAFNDVLTGSREANTLDGGAGDDRLNGDAGRDVLTGGDGADVFIFSTATHSLAADPDFITDFNGFAGDRLDLSGIDARSKTGGNQVFMLVNAFSGHAGELVVTHDVITTVAGDVNGDGQADFAVYLYWTDLRLSDIVL